MPGSFTPPTIQGATKRQTTNYNFVIPVFDAPGWGVSVERNFDVIDSVLFTITGLSNVRGAWENSVVYAIADRVVDINDDSLWQAYVGHTSSASGSFEDDRTANPTYWREVVSGSVPRGDWVTATNYNAGEIVTDNGRTGIVSERFTSTTSYDDDVADGHIVTIVDVSLFTSFDTAIVAAANKATLANADLFGIVDSAAGNALKNHTWTQVKAGVKTYADTLYQPLSAVLTATTASFLTTDETKLDGIEALADVTDAGNVGAAITGSSAQGTIGDTDRFAITEAGTLKYTLWSTIKTHLTTALITSLGVMINGLTSKATPVDADSLLLSDSAASNANKKLTWANLKATLNTYFNGLASVAVVAGDLLYGSGAAALTRLAKGTAGQLLKMNSGATAPEWGGAAVVGTAVTAPGGTQSIDFTGIPSWATHITIMVAELSTTVASNWVFRLGDSGGFETSGYGGSSGQIIDGDSAMDINSSGFLVHSASSANTFYGALELYRIDTNRWVAHGNIAMNNQDVVEILAGDKTLSGTLDRVQVLALAAFFDAGLVNIQYS